MARHLKLRVIIEDNDFRRLDLHSGMPKTLMELHNEICEAFGIERDFHIQFMDPDFNNEFMNITSVQDIQDRSTIKLLYTTNEMDFSPCSSKQPVPRTLGSSGTPVCSQKSPSVSSLSSSDQDSTIILTRSDSELRALAWPREFHIPRFPYDVELQLQRGNEGFRETGALRRLLRG